MNKVLLVGRLVRDPETSTTSSSIKYTRFTIAVSRPFGEDQADFIPIVAWRSQADFVEKYMTKGALVSIEGRFNSNTYKNNEGQNITRYEVSADRVQTLETKAQVEARTGKTQEFILKKPDTSTHTKVMTFEEESKPEQESNEVPWELDL